MKKFLAVFVTIIVFSFCVHGGSIKDRIELNNGKKLKGEIVNIEYGKLYLKKGKKVRMYTSDQIRYIMIDSENEKIISKIIENVPLQERNWCVEGDTDAYNYHKRGGGNFALGFVFGVFGFIGVAVTDAKAPYDPALISDTEKMNNTTYLMCYDKKAKKKNLGSAGIGWAASFILLLVIASG